MELDAVVVIPARDEEERIGACLRALARQTVPPPAFDTIVVVDACKDRTAEVVAAVSSAVGLPVTILDGPGAGAGAARKAGMDLACGRLLSAGRATGLIACTDADSRPAPDWLERQTAGASHDPQLRPIDPVPRAQQRLHALIGAQEPEEQNDGLLRVG